MTKYLAITQPHNRGQGRDPGWSHCGAVAVFNNNTTTTVPLVHFQHCLSRLNYTQIQQKTTLLLPWEPDGDVLVEFEAEPVSVFDERLDL